MVHQNRREYPKAEIFLTPGWLERRQAWAAKQAADIRTPPAGPAAPCHLGEDVRLSCLTTAPFDEEG